MPESYQTISHKVARTVQDLIRSKPGACLGLPTGRTPVEGYRILSSSSSNVNWSAVKCFGLDEYLNTDSQHAFQRYLETNLYNHINISSKHFFNPLHADNYDEIIAHYGGLDLTILGLGRNGHIAFNEPGTPLTSWTHSAWLSESTRQSNLEFFGTLDKVPTRAVTVGISTILSSRQIILMVSGEHKKEILTRALTGSISKDLPASFLQLHKKLTVLADFAY